MRLTRYNGRVLVAVVVGLVLIAAGFVVYTIIVH